MDGLQFTILKYLWIWAVSIGMDSSGDCESPDIYLMKLTADFYHMTAADTKYMLCYDCPPLKELSSNSSL